MVKRTYATSRTATRITKRRTMPMRSRPKPKSTKDELERLSRLVTKNTKLSQGAVQRNCQTLKAPLVPTDQNPCCFQADNFYVNPQEDHPGEPLKSYSACRVYQPSFGDAVDHYEPGATEAVGYFCFDHVNGIKTQGYEGGGTQQGDYNTSYWHNANIDFPDTGKYTALYADYRFHLEPHWSGTASTTPPLSHAPKIRLRIDFVKLKKPLTSQLNGVGPFASGTVGTQQMLPGTLAALGFLQTKNMYNPDYFSVIKTTEVFLEPDNQVGHTTYTTSVHLDLGGKTVNQGLTTSNFNPVNSDPLQNVWCIISSTQSNEHVHASDALIWKIDITRQCVWRDPIGSAAL